MKKIEEVINLIKNKPKLTYPLNLAVVNVNCNIEDVINVFLGYSQDGQEVVYRLNSNQFVFIKAEDKSLKDYVSFNKYLGFIKRFVYEETGENISISIGELIENEDKIAYSYKSALWTESMRFSSKKQDGVYSKSQFNIQKLLASLDDKKVKECFSILENSKAKEVFYDSELVKTAKTYFDNNLNHLETARKLFIHRNTLSYRFDKIEKSTGLDIRKFTDAVNFLLVMSILKVD